MRAEALRGTFDRETGICRALPAPSIQAPELLEASTAPVPITLDQDWAEAQMGMRSDSVLRGQRSVSRARS